MKKKILFIIPSLSSGGAEKSLVNLLNVFDYSKYEVDLAMLSKTGVFLDMIPDEVKIIDLPEDHFIFSLPLKSSVLQFVKKGRLALAYHRIAFALTYRKIKNSNLAEQKSWKHKRHFIGVLPDNYDAAIGYLEKTSIYFCVDCVKAGKKIGFIRTNYEKLGLDRKHDEKFFDRLTDLCANGSASYDVLKSAFPKLQSKLRVILNVVSTELIRKMSESTIEKLADRPTILSIGRLDHVKGFDLAIKAASMLRDEKFDFQWLIIGEGNQRAMLQNLITEHSLQDHFYLIGEKANPYPYLKKCDIYVQTSRYEGRSSTIGEAKIMGKPIISTDFESVFELLNDNVNALIVKKEPSEIADAVKKLLSDENLKNKLVSNLALENLDTTAELDKFYELL